MLAECWLSAGCILLLPVLLQLHKGKYVRDHSRLEVQPTGRYFLNMMLGECSTPAAHIWLCWLGFEYHDRDVMRAL